MLDRGDNATTTDTEHRVGDHGARHRAEPTPAERPRAAEPAGRAEAPVAPTTPASRPGTPAAPGLLARARAVVATVRGVGATREDPAALQFGGTDFVRAARFLADVQTPSGLVGRLAVGVSRPDDTAVTLRLLALLPRVQVTLSATPVGEEAWRFLGRSIGGVTLPRVAQSVLALPADLPTYLRGRPRQALRTGLNQAKRAGFACTELPTAEERTAVVAELEAARGISLAGDENLTGEHPRWFAARTPEGALVSVGLVLVDEEVALMRFLVAASEQDANSSAGRYLLHTHLVEKAIEGGATTMIVNSPFGWPTGLHQFQRILGYRVCNVKVARRR